MRIDRRAFASAVASTFAALGTTIMLHLAAPHAVAQAAAQTAARAAAQAPTQEAGPAPQERDSLEARVRVRMAAAVQRQIGLTDDQMRQLGVTNRRYERQRRDLIQREREIRIDLRDEIASGDTTRNAQVSRLLDQMLQVQRQRLEMLEAEQKELATFMTPFQRARYFGMEEQVRRRMEEMRDRAGQAQPGARRPGPGSGPVPRGGGRPGNAGPRSGATRPPDAGAA